MISLFSVASFDVSNDIIKPSSIYTNWDTFKVSEATLFFCILLCNHPSMLLMTALSECNRQTDKTTKKFIHKKKGWKTDLDWSDNFNLLIQWTN